MEANKVFRVKNTETGEYYKTYNGRTIWMMKHHPENSFKQKFKMSISESELWELKTYKIEEI